MLGYDDRPILGNDFFVILGVAKPKRPTWGIEHNNLIYIKNPPKTQQIQTIFLTLIKVSTFGRPVRNAWR